MRVRKHTIILFAVLLLIALVCVGGVLSTWNYMYATVNDMSISIDTGLFLWQELPSGEEGTIIEQTGTKVADSLNNPSSEINSAISNKEMFGMTTISSVDNIHGSQMRNELGIDPKANFLVEFPDENTRILYATTVDIGGSSSFVATEYLIPEGEWIYPVYRTIATKDASTGLWVQGATVRGHAKSGEYVTLFSTAPFFDPNTWTRGKIGSSMNDAIYVYQGQNVKAVLDSDTEVAYYKTTIAQRQQNVTVNIVKPSNAVINVYNANGKPLKVTGNGTNSVTFNNKKPNTNYYITVTGAKDIDFTFN